MMPRGDSQFSQGHIQVEYALILALVVLLSIPAIGFLGDVLSRAYAENEPTSQAGELFALLDASVPGRAGGVGAAKPNGTVSFGETQVQFATDENGRLDIGFPEGSSAATESTSREGVVSRLAANEFGALADAVANSGNAGEGVVDKLRRLQELAGTIAAYEDAIYANTGEVDGEFADDESTISNPTFMASAQAMLAMVNNVAEFNDLHAMLTDMLQNSGDAELLAEVEKNGGVVSHAAFANYIAPAQEKYASLLHLSDAFGTPQENWALASQPVGSSPAG